MPGRVVVAGGRIVAVQMRVGAGQPEHVRVCDAAKKRERLARHRAAPEQSDVDLGEYVEPAASRGLLPGRNVVDAGDRRHQSIPHDRRTRFRSQTVRIEQNRQAHLRLANRQRIVDVADGDRVRALALHDLRHRDRAAAIGIALEAGVDGHAGTDHATQLTQIVRDRVEIDLEPGRTQERSRPREGLNLGHDANSHRPAGH